MNAGRKFAAVLGGAVWLQGAPAPAQDLSIDDRLRQLIADPFVAEPASDQIRTGREDLILLQERDFFTFYVAPGALYTTNAFRSDRAARDDVVATVTTGLRVSTKIDQTYDVFAEIGYSGARYAENRDLGFNAFDLRLGGSAPVGAWTITGTYEASVAFDFDFDDRLVTLHTLGVSAYRPVALGPRVAIFPLAGVGLTLADPDDFSAVFASAGAQLVYVPDETVRLALGTEAYARHYFDFFEAVTGEDRTDFGFRASASALWEPWPNVGVIGAIAFTLNESTVDNLSYKALDIVPSLRLTFDF